MTDFLSWWADHWPLIPFVVVSFPAIYIGIEFCLDIARRKWRSRHHPRAPNCVHYWQSCYDAREPIASHEVCSGCGETQFIQSRRREP